MLNKPYRQYSQYQPRRASYSDLQSHYKTKTSRPGHRKSRNSIPTPNPNPRPPNEPRPNTTPNDQTGGQTPTAPVDRELQGFSTYQPSQGVPDPRDAQYWRDVSRLMFDRNAQLQQLQTEQIYSQTAYEKALENLARQTPLALRDTKESANRSGALYSSRTGDALSGVLQGASSQHSELESGFRDETSMREFLRSQIEQGASIEEAAALAEAIDRASRNEMNRPAPGGGGDLMDQLRDVLSRNKKNPRKEALKRKLKKRGR